MAELLMTTESAVLPLSFHWIYKFKRSFHSLACSFHTVSKSSSKQVFHSVLCRGRGCGDRATVKLTITAAIVQTVLPLMKQTKCHGKNPAGQGFKSGDFFAFFAKNYYSSLDRLDGRNGRVLLIALDSCM